MWGHSLLGLSERLGDLEIHVSFEEADLAMLDRFYIPTRYPNGVPDVIPQRAFLRTDAEAAIASARRILDLVRAELS